MVGKEWSEKKDGFDPATLRRLSGAERKEALGLLRQAVDDGDETAVEALVLLDPVAGPSFLRESLRTNPHEMVRVRIVATLLAAGRDPEAEAALPALLRALGRDPAAGDHIHTRPLVRACAAGPAAARAGRRTRRDEPDDGRGRAAAGLGRAPADGRDPDYRVALDGLRSADAALRGRTLAQLGMGDA